MARTKSVALESSLALSLAMVIATQLAFAQGPARGRIEPARDEALEIQAKHNLTVGKWYFEKRKAYEGARDRFQEIIDTYPEFSRMDEVLFYMGEIQLKLPTKDKEKAAGYFIKLLKDYPGSELAKKAQARLDELGVDSKRVSNH